MRIVAGKHRGRTLAAPEDGSVRPTADRVRENIFNILAHGRLSEDGGSLIAEARVLDAFAGSGALGLEALSRGAAEAVFLDDDLSALECLRRNVKALGEEAGSILVQADACRPPAPAKVRGNPLPRTLVFLDPPYRSALAAPALAALAAAGWLADAAIAVVELDARDAFAPPAGFTLLDERRYGHTRLLFLRWQAAEASR
ncbi:MAG: 16S rRNA (guanine(966)-N(2))-methyltransferase RsmD [Alphaproteobacteria bacterium]